MALFSGVFRSDCFRGVLYDLDDDEYEDVTESDSIVELSDPEKEKKEMKRLEVADME